MVKLGEALSARTQQLQEDKNKMINGMKHYHQDESLEIKMIDKNLIYPNPINKQYMEDVTQKQIEMLSENIAQNGLWHNLVVIDDKKGRYRLVSGEKRDTAIQLLDEETYRKRFPRGIACHVIKSDKDLPYDEEWRILLECNVLVASAKPDPKQVRDLIYLYNKMGVSKQEIITYLQEQIEYSKVTLERAYGAATAIPELQELEKEKVVSLTAMRVLCQGEDKELQAACCKMIVEDYPGQTINESMASDIKSICKKRLKAERAVASALESPESGEGAVENTTNGNGKKKAKEKAKIVESVGCIKIRTEVKKKILKSSENIKSIVKKEFQEMSTVEQDLCIVEMEAAVKKATEALEDMKKSKTVEEKK